jgi:enoyl-CoA hydratase/carnithine racemase
LECGAGENLGEEDDTGLRIEFVDDTQVLTIDREARRNAVNDATLRELRSALEESAREQVRAIVITGSGTAAFSAGSDIKELAAMRPEGRLAHTGLGQSVIEQIEDHPCPVIAAIEGYCLGGGLELALACDLRIAGAGGRFGQPEVGLHALPSWGGTFRLPRVVGPGRASEMIVFGRTVDADEALRWGLVAEVVAEGSACSRALEVARTLASSTDRDTAAQAKRLLVVGYGMPTRTARHLEYLADMAQSRSVPLEASFGAFTGRGSSGQDG